MKSIYRKGPNGFHIRSRLPVHKGGGGRTSKIAFLDKNLKRTKVKEEIMYVKKNVHKARYKRLVSREIEWLQKMEDFDRTPNFISREKDTFIMTYVGAKARKHNLPKDWKDQIQYICDSLKEYDCYHNDIKYGEILVKDDKIHLVDFQWATSTLEELLELTGRQRKLIPNEDYLWVKCQIIEEHG